MNWPFGDDEDRELTMAREAGWSWADLTWERQMENGIAAYKGDDIQTAEILFRQADLLSRAAFPRNDLRKASVAANLALLAAAQGDIKSAQRHQRRALRIWQSSAEKQIDDMQIGPRTRSSLYHLRMETRHRETFHDNMRIRYRKFARETEETLEHLLESSLPHRHYARWIGERPPVHDDTRKVMAACLLIIDPS